MKFKYFGTAAAECWPALFCSCDNCERAKKSGGRNIRTRSQAVINGDLLIDLPPDTYFHVINYGLDLTKIKNIIITHDHEDHFYIYDLHRAYPPFAYDKNKEKIKQINIYGNKSVNKYAAELENHKDILNFQEFSAFEKYNIGKYFITPLKADHDYSQDCFIYLIEDPKSKILYANDTGYFPDETWEFLFNNCADGKKLDFVSLDTTNGMLDGRRGHMGIEVCGEVKARLIETGAADDKTIFCLHHFSHNGGKIYDELVPIAAESGFLVSYDGMELKI